VKRVLFVDDERKVLEGLQRMLRPQRREWAMAFADGGEAALALLAQEPFDVVVTDMRMPGMDGAELLEKVRQLYPRVGRIVLSGHTELEFAFRAARVAHQFLLKPCDADMLRAAILRTCNLQTLLASESLARVVGEMGELPSAPRVYSSLTAALGDPNSSLGQIGAIIEQDVALSAKILQLVNSAFFGLSRDITSVHHAVSYLGVDILQGLVLSVEAFRVFKSSPCLTRFSIDEFQAHAQLTARIARTFTLPKVMGDAAVSACVLHDVGKLVLAARLPDQLQQAMGVASEQNRALHEVEQELYGVTHAEIGAYLLGLWGLPAPVTEAVAYHHVPCRVPHHGLDPVSVVYLSNLLAHEFEGTPTAAEPAPVLQELGVIDQYPAIQERARLAWSAGREDPHAC
jgi:HD-like signal output (HDOD) protein